MMRLTVHLNPLAAFRAIGPSPEPDLFTSALAVDLAGADGIVCRLEDGASPLQARDVAALKKVVKNHLTIEVEPTEELVRAAMEIKPDQVTLLPPVKGPQDAGLDVVSLSVTLRELVRSLHAAGIDVSLLVSPEIDQVKEARKLEVDAVTLNTAAYAACDTAQDAVVKLEELESAALAANRLGLTVLASRGLNHRNIAPIAAYGTVDEALLDHALFSRALFIGLDRALAEVRDAVRWHSPRG